jgi:hypothetical protein
MASVEKGLCRVKADLLDELRRRSAKLGLKEPGEVTGAYVCDSGQGCHRMR